MPLDPELEAFAATAAAAFDSATKAQRRALWRALRSAVGEVRGSTWRPAPPWAGLLAQLGQRAPRKVTTRLGLAKGGQINTKGDTRLSSLPWAWASDEPKDAA